MPPPTKVLSHFGRFIQSVRARFLKGAERAISSDRRLARAHNMPSAPQYACAIAGCAKTFDCKLKRGQHHDSHEMGRAHPCTWADCNYAGKRRQHLNVHMRVHTGVKPFECTAAGCAKVFTQNGTLRKHLTQAHGMHPPKCAHCPKTFWSTTAMKKHVALHVPLACTISGCTFTTTAWYRMNQHKRVHTRPFACNVLPTCLKAFATKSQLRLHIAAHSMQYVCGHEKPNNTRCEKRFAVASRLAAHTARWHSPQE